MRIQFLLKRKAIAWAGQMTQLARSLAPAHIRSAISSHVEEKNSTTFIIRTTANRQLAPDARAQEYGSGIHARRGAKKKYTIRPKNKRLLAFNWEVANANPERFTFAPDGRVVFHSVQHPGIEAANSGKGYIGPAQIAIRKRIKEELSKEIGETIKMDLRESFGRK